MGMRVLIAEDQPAARSALRLLLEEEAGVDVVGEATRAAELLQRVIGLDIHLLLLDWALPGLQGEKLLPVLRNSHPEIRVIALSVRLEVSESALAAGADAFVSKGEPPEKLLRLLRTDEEEIRGPESATHPVRWPGE